MNHVAVLVKGAINIEPEIVLKLEEKVGLNRNVARCSFPTYPNGFDRFADCLGQVNFFSWAPPFFLIFLFIKVIRQDQVVKIPPLYRDELVSANN